LHHDEFYFIVVLLIKSGKKIMNNQQLERFNLLSQKVIDENASFNELKELKEILSSFNNLVGSSLPQVIINFNQYMRASQTSL